MGKKDGEIESETLGQVKKGLKPHCGTNKLDSLTNDWIFGPKNFRESGPGRRNGRNSTPRRPFGEIIEDSGSGDQDLQVGTQPGPRTPPGDQKPSALS